MKKELRQKQFFEGKVKGCKGNKCGCSCCDDGTVEEWVNEYFLFHESLKDLLESHGVKIIFKGDRVRFKNCSTGKECKFIKYSSNKDRDLRPIDCKIYPYQVDWNDIDFDKKIVNLYFEDKNCPLAKNNEIPYDFKKEVEAIVKRDFAVLFYGANFKVRFIDKTNEKL